MNTRENPLLVMICAALTLAVVGGAIYTIWLIGREAMTALAGVLIGGVTLGVVLAAASLPIRAYRKQDQTGESHHYHDGTTRVIERHTLDGRAPAQNDIRLLQLPAAGQAAAFPELLRASFRAGLLAAPNGDQAVTTTAPDAELRELDPATVTADDWNYSIARGDFSDWRGTLRP